MRCCGNCYNGHYNLSERGEEIYCDESEFVEEKVNEDDCCEYHRFCPGEELDKNYIFYDETYIAPGFIIVNVENKKTTKFFKIYEAKEDLLSTFAIRAYCLNGNNESIEFSFRDIEDDENGLYDCFTDFYNNLSGKSIMSVDPLNQGNSNLKLETNTKVTKIVLSRDKEFKQNPTDYIDILLGDASSCNNYDDIFNFYQDLSKVCTKKISSDMAKKLLLIK